VYKTIWKVQTSIKLKNLDLKTTAWEIKADEQMWISFSMWHVCFILYKRKLTHMMEVVSFDLDLKH